MRKEGEGLVVVGHRLPRFIACDPEVELTESYAGLVPLFRVTTIVYEARDVDYVAKDCKGVPVWQKERPWCGQTASVFQGTVPSSDVSTVSLRSVSQCDEDPKPVDALQQEGTCVVCESAAPIMRCSCCQDSCGFAAPAVC